METDVKNSAVEDQTKPDEHQQQSSVTLGPQLSKRESWKQWWETWSPLINVCIAVLGLLIIFLQLRIMDRQTDLMDHSLRVSERAYVGIASLTANWEAREVVIMLHNIGSVPAKGIKVRALEIRATPSNSDMATQSKEKVYEKLDGSTFPWAAGEDIFVNQLFPGPPMRVAIPLRGLEAEEMDAILKKQEILYVGGQITYDDGFGKGDSTIFAFEYTPPPNEAWTAHSDLSKFFKQK